MKTLRKIELLAPAKDLATGKAAIDSGADAVYIGGPGFGARHAAGNSAEDVARLVRYAHPFGVRVYATLNTLLFDSELEEAWRVARSLIEAGVDALIVQDPAFLRMGLTGVSDVSGLAAGAGLRDGSAASGLSGGVGCPSGSGAFGSAGVEFHASTQTSNIRPEDVAFLGQAGFRRVILERALSLEEIKAIRAATASSGVELEVFVHGAICVGYSGRCFLSRSIFRDKQAPASDEKYVGIYRSGNRGDCSQPCRLAWDLVDGDGKALMRGKHLLSLRDLDLSARIGELLDAGVSSFKIEGRLKDAAYVRNIVSHYRRLLDEELAERPQLERASVGRSEPDFEPSPSKGFTRGASEYYFDGAVRGVASFDTPKAVGEYMGQVSAYDKNGYFTLARGSSSDLAAGDGICFFADGELRGTNINRVEGGRVYPNRMDGIAPGVEVYRNYDHIFTRTVERSRTRRRIGVTARVEVRADEVRVEFTDEGGVLAVVKRSGVFDLARDAAKMEAVLRSELSKSGDTVFEAREVVISGEVRFVPVSIVADMRREGLNRLWEARERLVPERYPAVENMSVRFPRERIEACENVVNRLSEQFYRDHEVREFAPALELSGSLEGEVVMRSRYCIRREIGECLRSFGRSSGHPSGVSLSSAHGQKEASALARELYLVRGKERFRLGFDCAKCEMTVIKI